MNALWRHIAIAALASSIACTVEEIPPGQAAASEEIKAVLVRPSGDVKIKRSAGDDWISAAEGAPLYENDKVRTAKGAAVGLRFTSGSQLALGEDALIGIAEGRAHPGADRTDVTVLRGKVDAELQDAVKQSLSVGTPAATVRAGREIVFQ